MNEQVNMQKRLAEALMDAVKLSDKCGFDGRDCDWAPKAWFVAQQLLKNGVLVPPVKEGQTVYAAIRMEDPSDGDEGIDEWQVHGVMYKEGKWYAIDKNGDESVVGAWDCLLTREEAQKLLDEEEKKNDKDAEKVG